MIKFNHREIKADLRDEADKSVFAEIFRHREYRAVEEIIRKAKYPILDIGAHAGFFSLYARALNPLVKISAVEPEPDNLCQLRKNFKLNKIKDVEIVSGVLAGTTAERELFVAPDSHNHSLNSEFLSGKNKVIKVRAYSFSDLSKKIGVKKFDLVKMDVEGGEYEIFDGLEKDDFAAIGAIILEYHDFAKNNHKKLENILRENKFGVQKFPSHFDRDMGFLLGVRKGF